MILKAYEVNKINTNINNIILFYGQNQGAKEEVILNLIKDRKKNFLLDRLRILLKFSKIKNKKQKILKMQILFH